MKNLLSASLYTMAITGSSGFATLTPLAQPRNLKMKALNQREPGPDSLKADLLNDYQEKKAANILQNLDIQAQAGNSLNEFYLEGNSSPLNLTASDNVELNLAENKEIQPNFQTRKQTSHQLKKAQAENQSRNPDHSLNSAKLFGSILGRIFFPVFYKKSDLQVVEADLFILGFTQYQKRFGAKTEAKAGKFNNLQLSAVKIAGIVLPVKLLKMLGGKLLNTIKTWLTKVR